MKLKLLLLGCVVFTFQFIMAQKDLGEKSPLINTTMPDFEGVSLTNKLWSSEELRGNVILLNFWEFGCPGCMAQVEYLNELNLLYLDSDFVLLTIAPYCRENLIQFLDTSAKSQFHILSKLFNVESYEFEIIPACTEKSDLEKRISIIDEDTTENINLKPECEEILSEYGVKSYPSTFIIDKKGVVRYFQTGFAVSQSFFNMQSSGIISEKSKKQERNDKQVDLMSNPIITDYISVISRLLNED